LVARGKLLYKDELQVGEQSLVVLNLDNGFQRLPPFSSERLRHGNHMLEFRLTCDRAVIEPDTAQVADETTRDIVWRITPQREGSADIRLEAGSLRSLGSEEHNESRLTSEPVRFNITATRQGINKSSFWGAYLLGLFTFIIVVALIAVVGSLVSWIGGLTR